MKRPVASISELDLSALTKLGLHDMKIDNCEAKELATKLYCCSKSFRKFTLAQLKLV